ncbi:hypothetical protein LTR56_000441 [Elasticomyces elasticus]|nr:hypothetical protein LTR22_023114 [Elasticomyces elasticus]KAK3660683.1 hypothetical protein LTR56_000441 [Elasticomyces elasticus]KAK4922829.1 hypothetical protein LTR49_009836 [Elasticomyces elasticus]KAK5759794.1 hypothetical protein LTS12_010134 [Elasticomyces elasticus]
MGRFSPVAPARVRVQLVPVGRIERSRFNAVCKALAQHASDVKLADIEVRDDQPGMLLSPQAFPQGSLLLSYCTSSPSVAEQQISPYELFRSPQLVLGIVGGLSSDELEQQTKELGQAAETLREHHPHAIHRHIVLLPESEGGPLVNKNNITRIAKTDDDDSGLALLDTICDIAAQFLVELSIYAKATQASPTIQTPGQRNSNRPRAWSIRSDDDKTGSGYATPTLSTDLASPIGDDNISRPPSRGIRSPPPPTSFDQIRGANTVPTALARSDSRTSDSSRQGARNGSQDRSSVHGIGPGIAQSKNKARDRGRARVGIVVGHIYMMAGHWSEALRMLVEHTNAAKKHSDPLWHAKGLEGIVVCMLLMAHEGLEFSIPTICYPAAERSHSTHVHKLSVNLPSDFRPADAARQASVRRLSTSLPDLLKQILTLYESGEGTLELPALVLAEVKIRFANLMAILYQSNNELNGQTLAAIATDSLAEIEKNMKLAGSGPVGSLSKPAIADILSEAQQTQLEDLTASDRIAILTGAHNVYAMLGMDRKKASALKDIMALLTAEMNQARKLGAAEAGIHPAATSSTDSGADAIKFPAAENDGVKGMVDVIARVYGINLMSARQITTSESFPFGAEALQSQLTKMIASLCEASPDPKGVMDAITTLLKSVTAGGRLEFDSSISHTIIPKEEQARLVSTLARSMSAAQQLKQSEVEAQFWDKFLVRGLDFAPREPRRNLVPYGRPDAPAVSAQQQVAGNPLLYDPNAARDSKAIQLRQVFVINEPQICLVTLQNSLEVPIEIESINLDVVGHSALQFYTQGFRGATLEPLQRQQVQLAVVPNKTGDFDIVGCRVKIASCQVQSFSIYAESWAPMPEQLVKHQGQSGMNVEDRALEGPKPKRTVIPATATMWMPLLKLAHMDVPEGSLMMLSGEMQVVTIQLFNSSNVAAIIYNFLDESGCMSVSLPGSPANEASGSGTNESDCLALVKYGDTEIFCCSVVGHTGVTDIRLDVYYRPVPFIGEATFARVLSLPLSITVQDSLLLDSPDVDNEDESFFVLSFDVTNAWTRPLGVRFELRYPEGSRHNAQPDAGGQVAPGETLRFRLRCHRDLYSGYGHETLGELWEALWKTVVVVWQGDDHRGGNVLIRDLPVTKEMLEVVQGV